MLPDASVCLVSACLKINLRKTAKGPDPVRLNRTFVFADKSNSTPPDPKCAVQNVYFLVQQFPRPAPDLLFDPLQTIVRQIIAGMLFEFEV